MHPRILFLGEVDYLDSVSRMQHFTASRKREISDEFWVLSHPPVYTQGTSCDAQPVDSPGLIPVVKTDRGGQITYHGPGQLIIYLLLDIKRLGMGPKRLVSSIESAIISLLDIYGVIASTHKGAPGVYVSDEKIAALGLRIRQGACYHGLSLNINMDLAPFEHIDPCGYADLKVTQLSAQGVGASIEQITNQLIDCLIESIYSHTSTESRA
jgi:lipoyl(octanoyl) transferase